jgi:UDP-N-acetylmuramyl tripeptide synthase
MHLVDSFPYFGPNRRSELPLVEALIAFEDRELSFLDEKGAQVESQLIEMLQATGIISSAEDLPSLPPTTSPMGRFAAMFALIALLIQRHAGHRVNFFSLKEDPDQQRCRCLVEHEHCDVGMTAVNLASKIVTRQLRDINQALQEFHDFAEPRLLPLETQAIIDAAYRRDIPYLKLDRHPFAPGFFDHLTGKSRSRPNGLLMLGHACHQRFLEGTVCLSGTDTAQNVESAGEGVTKTDLAPALQEIPPADSSLLKSTAEQIVADLFPPQAPSRIPIVAITGTNGKTTSCRMVNHIMIGAGLKPGLVCSDGRYINNKMDKPGDGCSRTGHVQLLTKKKINAAVLEAHYAGLFLRGFAFHWCDVAVCLNVTEEHINEKQIESVHQLAEIKRSLLERARHAAVLNADDGHCLDMVPFLTAKNIVLVSMQTNARDLADRVQQETSQCVLEEISGDNWIVIHDRKKKVPVIKVNNIPACFDGVAGHNVSNAMHAIAACYFLRLDLANISNAMGSFHVDFATNPGRLNIHDTGSFRVILDYAYNPDAVRKLCEFIDQQEVSGRKILMLGVPGNRHDEGIKAVAGVVAGHFDHYVCRRFPNLRGRKEHEVTKLLQARLLEAGVSKEQITVVGDPAQAIRQSLEMGMSGDLLVLISSGKEKYGMWEQITAY